MPPTCREGSKLFPTFSGVHNSFPAYYTAKPAMSATVGRDDPGAPYGCEIEPCSFNAALVGRPLAAAVQHPPTCCSDTPANTQAGRPGVRPLQIILSLGRVYGGSKRPPYECGANSTICRDWPPGRPVTMFTIARRPRRPGGVRLNFVPGIGKSAEGQKCVEIDV